MWHSICVSPNIISLRLHNNAYTNYCLQFNGKQMKDTAQGCADHLMLAQIKPVNISYAYNMTPILVCTGGTKTLKMNICANPA